MHQNRAALAALTVGLSLAAPSSLWAQVAQSAASAPVALSAPGLVATSAISGADTAWLMVSTALVLLMTLPGIALFYGGMVRRQNVINTMASVVGIAAVVSVLWFALAYSLAFTPGSGILGGFIGGVQRMGFAGMDYLGASAQVSVSHIAPHVPESVFAMFQLTFAIITCALVVGALVERMHFGALLLFSSLWLLLVYAPIAHWVWEPGGWLAKQGALDFAGGSVVHINAGAAALVCAYALGPRTGYGREPFVPFNLGLTMAGTGLLWVGWFGFNAGSALAADGRAGLALLVTHVAAAAGALSWMGAEWLARKRASLLGLCSGVVAGLVAITPAAGFVTPRSALVIGLVAGVACYWGATTLKRKLQADDSLDVFGVHGVGGLVGAMLTGVFADPDIAGVQGSVVTQLIACVAVLGYSLVMSAVVLWITSRVTDLRVRETDERTGLDLALHNEQIGH
ncbi:MAG: ammonium transporter [Hydrogenophaga sp.]|uniref:ammonium transporter n=1 Tax=Hydrogenophaga sp. TaxID=1904254 RepID=UPI0027276F98|nr:ammonium transporter [Hydrogenophaga sp.]MDO9480782.1 ammonium transporter [Hydrogenophaga sp.]MDO9568611.1 ammonium transporter [Hydrogenophaga sp.]MDP1895497.1 ammonium transporter [Hydrogenophaga sp.]MDP2096841.1 ammonium transporter [Hydrogenophaga sp.]MDP3343261.1 ammonium transporter [Hydrogenophaga sp.]